ncbi:MAG TPA: glycoside hydrolase family 88 protein [Polyangiaceae bacterium]|nr:glycoside hydrolase family 88 protein [Polyangiaceae bacterium]
MSSRILPLPLTSLAAIAVLSLAVSACGGSNKPETNSNGGAGGAGGTMAMTGSGGTGATAGHVGSGGTSATGGTMGSGGATSTGGSSAAGAPSGAGGSSGASGSGATGGSSTAGSGTSTGGAMTSGAGSTSTGAGGMSAAGAPGTAGAGNASNAGAGGTSSNGCPTVSDFATWPSGKGPADIGKLAVNSFKPHTGDAYSGAGYAWTFAYVGSLQYTKLTGDTTNNSYLISHFDCTQQGPDNSSSATVDTRAFGDLPLEIFLENQDMQCKSLGMARADAQWANTADTAITPDARYWSDDMYMITGLQDFGFRAAQDQKYLNRMALTMKAYLTALQQSDGLFWHTKQTMAYWGRANGWFASGMALLLQDLPAGSDRDTIMAGYKKQMDGLLGVQITSAQDSSGKDVGAWRQVLDRTDASAEMSCTAMFTYALITGIKNGWLTDPKYVAAAKAGWTAVGNKTDSTGQLSQVCPGTGQAYGQSGVGTDLKSQQDYYINLESSFAAGDQHGQAPLLWSAIALLRTDCPGMH